MKKPLAIISVILSLDVTVAKRLKLTAIFDPIMEGPASCAKWLDLAPPLMSEKPLSKYWDQVYDLATVANEQLQEHNYESNFETRKLLRAFFGIVPGRGPDYHDSSVPIHRLYVKQWQKVTTWHKRLLDYIQTPIDEKDDRPFLACGGGFLEFQRGSDKFLESDGSPKKNAKGKTVTLAEVVKEQKLEYTDWWFWRMTVHGQTDYVVLKRHEKSKKLKVPGPVDPKTGEVDICDSAGVEGIQAMSFTKGYNSDTLGVKFGEKRSGILLCPASFEIEKRKKEYTKKTVGHWPPQLRHDIDLSPQPQDTDLYVMGTNALTLYHEMWHLAFGVNKDEFDDPKVVSNTPDAPMVTANRDKRGHIWPKFPQAKARFEIEDSPALGPIQCMYVALWDYAGVPWATVGEYFAIRSPECYAWFDMALYLQIHGEKPADWSSGGSREPGQDFQSVVIKPSTDEKDGVFRHDPWVP